MLSDSAGGAAKDDVRANRLPLLKTHRHSFNVSGSAWRVSGLKQNVTQLFHKEKTGAWSYVSGMSVAGVLSW
jgi:hypothetical protein